MEEIALMALPREHEEFSDNVSNPVTSSDKFSRGSRYPRDTSQINNDMFLNEPNDESVMFPDDLSEEEYRPPRRPRTSKARRSKSITLKPKTYKPPVSAKPGNEKHFKSIPTSFLSQDRQACSYCSHVCPSTSTLAKHVLNAHTRPFTCTFARYGCPATFGSKNEYKRHVSSQHLRPGLYRCDLGSCIPQTKPQQGKDESYNHFNRKDIFTQHIRRMHAPAHTAPKVEKDAFEASLEHIRARCWVKMHDPPPRTVCGFCLSKEVEKAFEGKNAWEERMEHVARHLERGDLDEVEDTGLRDWMVQEGLLTWNPTEETSTVIGTWKQSSGVEDAGVGSDYLEETAKADFPYVPITTRVSGMESNDLRKKETGVAIPRTDPASTNGFVAGQAARTRVSRVTQACEACRQRRSKCDGKRPTCKPCHLRNQGCFYEGPTKDRK